MAITSTEYSFRALSASTHASGQTQSDSVGLSDGNFATIGTNGSAIGLDIRSVDGTLVSMTTNITGTDGAITQLTNGNIVVSGTSAGGTNYTILTSSGLFVSGGVNSFGSDASNTDVAALAGGGFVIVDQFFFGGTDNNIGVTVRDAGGTLVTSFTVDDSGANDRNACVAGLADGGFAVAFERVLAGGDTQIWTAVYNADGSVRRAPALLDDIGTINRSPSVTALPSGGFAVAYEDNGWDNTQPDITCATFDSGGNVLAFTLASTDPDNDGEASVTTLSNGLGLVTFTNDFNNSGDFEIYATLIDPATGAVLSEAGNTLDPIDANIIVTSDSSVAALGLARFAVSYTDSTTGVVLERTLQLARTTTTDDDSDAFTGDEAVDIVYGNGGDDTLDGGANDDWLFGDDGFDVLVGGAGADNMSGGNDDDVFVVSGSETIGDTINGGLNHDTILVTDDAGADARLDRTTILGGIEEIEFSADNTLATSVTILAEQVGAGIPSNLLIDGGAAGVVAKFRVEMGRAISVNLSGFAFQDFQTGGGGNGRFLVLGDNNNETIVGTSIRDEIYGSGGNDTLTGRGGGDYLSGGLGSDTASYSTAGFGVTASLANAAINTGDAAGDTYNSIENLSGSNFNDSLNGNNGANTIRGGVGNDTLKGDNGNDTLSGGTGNDVLNGGLGADTLEGGDGSNTASYADAATGVIASLANAAINTGEAAGDTYNSIERLIGSNFDDALNGANVVNNTLRGGSGNDTLKGYTGNDALEGGLGNDTFVFNTALNAATNIDTILDFTNQTGNDDRFLLDDAFFVGISGDPATSGRLLSGFYKNITTGAQDANDRILYRQSTGELIYDSNGLTAGGQTVFAKVTINTPLSFADFFVN